MKKVQRLIVIWVICFVSCYFMPVCAVYDVIGLNNFSKTQNYTAEIFSDVPNSAWYYNNVVSVYEYELMLGKSSGIFAPIDNISVAESIALTVRINYIYFHNAPIILDLYEDVSWYEPYVSIALDEGLVKETYLDYNAPATRAQFAEILAASIDPLDFEEINWIDDGTIPDVPVDADYADAVYMLYRAGVLAGSDDAGSFNPNSTITRAEAAAVITRIIDPNLRQTTELNGNY